MYWLLLPIAYATTRFQVMKARQLLELYKAPQFVTIVDGIQSQTYAFTDSSRKIIYVDMTRFECCPNSFINVINHEIGHTKGGEHGQGGIMNYSLTTDTYGHIINDNIVLK